MVAKALTNALSKFREKGKGNPALELKVQELARKASRLQYQGDKPVSQETVIKFLLIINFIFTFNFILKKSSPGLPGEVQNNNNLSIKTNLLKVYWSWKVCDDTQHMFM